MLVRQLFPVAGPSGRTDVDRTLSQPFVNCNFPDEWCSDHLAGDHRQLERRFIAKMERSDWWRPPQDLRYQYAADQRFTSGVRLYRATAGRTVFYTRQEADQAIGRYIDGFYNPVPRHSARDFTSLAPFEKTAAERTNASPLKWGKSRPRETVVGGLPTFADQPGKSLSSRQCRALRYCWRGARILVPSLKAGRAELCSLSRRPTVRAAQSCGIAEHEI